MKRFSCFIGGCGLAYATCKFGALVYTLLAAGQFFTPLLAGAITLPCAVLGIILFAEAFE